LKKPAAGSNKSEQLRKLVPANGPRFHAVSASFSASAPAQDMV